MSKRTQTATRKRRTFRLSRTERLFLVLYRAAPPLTRAAAAQILRETVLQPLPHERTVIHRRLTRAARALSVEAPERRLVRQMLEVK